MVLVRLGGMYNFPLVHQEVTKVIYQHVVVSMLTVKHNASTSPTKNHASD